MVLVVTAVAFANSVHAQTGNVASGEILYFTNCATCHFPVVGTLAARATTLQKLNNALNSVNQMLDRFGGASFFSEQQKADIVAYIVSQVSGTPPPPLQNQTITFPVINSFAWNGIGVTPTATASSLLPVTYVVISGPCLINGSKLVGTAVGLCTIGANQVGNSSFSAARQESRQVTTTFLGLTKRGGVDIDGNNRGQIVVRTTSGSSMIGRLNTTTGQFDFTATTDPGVNFRYVGLVDFGNNGRTDLAIQDVSQGEFGEVFTLNELLPSSKLLMRTVKRVWDVQAVGDLDGDGIGDMVWRYLGFTPERPGDTGVSYIWFSNVGGGVPVVRKRGGAPLDWQLLGAADLDGDGAADMVYISPAKQVRVLMATAQRTCANFAAGTIPTEFTALRLADFTANGRAEILLRNNATGEVRLMALDAVGLALPPFVINPLQDPQDAPCTATTTTISNSLITLPITDPTWRFYAAEDVDGDGRHDIIWRQASGQLTLWKMNGSFAPTVTTNAGTAPAGFQPNSPTPATSPVF